MLLSSFNAMLRDKAIQDDPTATPSASSKQPPVRTNGGVRRMSGFRREPVVSVKDPTLIPTSY